MWIANVCWQATITCRMHPDCTMNFYLQYWTSSRESSVDAYMDADMICVITHSARWVMWMCDTSQIKTGGVDGRCGSVECGVWEWQILGHMSVECQNMWTCGGGWQMWEANVGMQCCVEWVTDVGDGYWDVGSYGERCKGDLWWIPWEARWRPACTIVVDAGWWQGATKLAEGNPKLYWPDYRTL